MEKFYNKAKKSVAKVQQASFYICSVSADSDETE